MKKAYLNSDGEYKHPYYEVLERGFRCMHCDAPSEEVKILDSRATLKNDLIMKRRTRHCKVCNRRYSTYEVNADDLERLLEGQDLLMKILGYAKKWID